MTSFYDHAKNDIVTWAIQLILLAILIHVVFFVMVPVLFATISH